MNYQHMHAYLEIVTLQSWAGDLKPKRSYRNATPGFAPGIPTVRQASR